VDHHTSRQAGHIEGRRNHGGTLGKAVQITAQIMRYVGAGEAVMIQSLLQAAALA
jgi:hypothetical protein